MTDEDDTKRVLQEWSAALLDELGLAGAPVDIDAILKLAGIAAHSVIRPAAPVTTYIVGYAAGLAATHAEGSAAAGSAGPESAGPAESAGPGVASSASARAEALARRFGDSSPG